MRPSVSAVLVLSACALGGLVRPAGAADAPPAAPPAPSAATPPGAAPAAAGVPAVAVPRVDGLVVDGTPDEAGWAGAASLPTEDAAVSVRLAASGGRLVMAVDVAEDAGFPCALRGFVAAEGVATAAEAVAFSYAPQDVRGPRWVVRKPAGEGRAAVRAVGGFDGRRAGRWSLEVALPFADLGLRADDAPLRAALTVVRRLPNQLVAAPPGSAFAPVTAFARLLPPPGGFAAGAVPALDAAALAAEDLADRQRLGHWRAFVDAFEAARRTGAGSKEELVRHVDAAIAARPDLAVLHLGKAEVLEALGDVAGARAALEAGLARLPHLREARWALAQLDVAAWVEPPSDQPSDYAAAYARLDAVRPGRPADDPGLRLAEAVLRYRQGDFAAAIPLFEAVVAGYPVGDDTRGMATACARYREAFAEELSFRRRDEAAALPRARLETSRGAVVVELFEEDAPNTVANFVWLADAKFYDGTTFHRVVPFFMAQGGDPLSREGDPRVGQGGPGYAIPTEPSRRRPFRGVLAMAHARKDTEGSQFFLTTGTSAHLEGEYSVFGRVLEGQDVVDRLVQGDRIVKVEVLRRRDRPYRPTTVAATPAPAPKASGPVR